MPAPAVDVEVRLLDAVLQHLHFVVLEAFCAQGVHLAVVGLALARLVA